MADGEVAAQAAQGRFVEDLADQPEVLVDDDRGAVGHRDPGRLLTAVLEGVQAEIGQLRDLLPRRPDTEDATGVLRSGIRGIEVVRQPSVTARHPPTVPAAARRPPWDASPTPRAPPPVTPSGPAQRIVAVENETVTAP